MKYPSSAGSTLLARPAGNVAYVVATLLAALVCAGLMPAAEAQEPLSRLGLSAAPDHYDDTIFVGVGDPFTLYVVMTGPEGVEPLPFDLQSVEWAVFTSCCGATPVLVADVTYPPEFQAIGEPDSQVVSEATTCVAGDIIVLAELAFEWGLEGETSFAVSAGAMTAALDCEGEAHLLANLIVNIQGATLSWSDLKEIYGDTADQGKRSER